MEHDLKLRWILTKLHYKLIVSFILLLTHTPLATGFICQNDSLRIKHFSLEDGLSQVSINALLKDSEGFVWVGTQDGLNRFDGNRFEQFKSREKDSTSIPGNYINTLGQDSEGNVWVGTQGNGLCWYDKETGIFHRYQLQNAGDKNESISDILFATDGVAWIASKVSGLHKLNPSSSGYIHAQQLDIHSPNALSMGSSGHLWVGDVDGNVFKIKSLLKGDTAFLEKELSVKGQIRAFYETENYLLIGSNDGLFIYNRKKQELEPYDFLTKQGEAIKYVTSFSQAGQQKIWVGTGNGLFLFDWKSRVFAWQIGESEDNAKGLSSSSVESLLRLSDKQLFVGTGLNLYLLDFSNAVFKNISKDQKGRHLLNYNVIFSIYKENNNLWVGTAEGGLNLIQNDKIFYFNNDIFYGNVRAIAKDKIHQRLWVATTRGLGMIDLDTFDPYNPEFKTFHYDPSHNNSISLDQILDIVIDKNQNVWGGTYGQGVFRLSLNEDDEVLVKRFKHSSNNRNSLVNDFVHCITVDNENNVWIGTEEGVSKLTPGDGQVYSFTNFSKNPDPNYSLSTNSVYDILVDKAGHIWIGTQQGLNKILKNGKIKSWTEHEQFPNAVVYSIQEDKNGNLFLGTNDGIVSFNPVTEQFVHYGVEDGIQSKEFDIHAKFRDSEGKIYLGGVSGITYFHPDDLSDLDKPQPLYFSQLRVKDQEVTTATGQLLTKALRRTNKIEIREGQFPFYLQFSTIDFRYNKNVEFAYKLLPADKDWNILKDPEIQFLTLPAGHYTLLVNGFSRGRLWGQPPLEMDLHILPPWWASWWAYALYMILITLVVYGIYRFQMSKKLAFAESRRLKGINEFKNRLYTNITHEFRTPLTVIIGMADSLRTNLENRKIGSVNHSINMIEENGKKLLGLVNEMLDLAKVESGNMELQMIQADVLPCIKYLCNSFEALAHDSNINLILYTEIEELVMDFDTDKLSVIVGNLLSNAIKFTPPNGEIVVHLKRVIEKEHQYLYIKVKDNGIGISGHALPNIFNRFYQEDDTSSRQREGTGIGLALTKELVELMKGSIEARSIVSKGSEFIVLIPITNRAPAVANELPSYKPEIAFDKKSHPHEPVTDIQADLPLALVIEDNPDVNHYLKTCLSGKYNCLQAYNGPSGIELAIEKMPDIIICDVMMPGMNGFEVCKNIKSDERTDHIPIIVLTAKGTMKDRLAGLSYGADAYLVKPFEKAELFTRLEQLVLLRKKIMQKFEHDGPIKFLKNRSENPETKFLQRVVKVIYEEMENHGFGSAQLARKLYLSESQVYRKLKAITDRSTAVFIRSVRLQKARELIQTTDKTISEVAYEVGFNDPSWFSRAFKEEFGFAPSEIHA